MATRQSLLLELEVVTQWPRCNYTLAKVSISLQVDVDILVGVGNDILVKVL
jgi:hypothetical protein